MPIAMPDDFASGPVGKIVAGRYRITDVIGGGGQALVCRAHDQERNQAVAVKIVSGPAARDPQAVARFARERDVLRELARSNVVRVLDTVCEDRTFYLVMELLEGSDLELMLEQVEGRGELLPVKRIVQLIDPIVDTLDAAHARGIYHRDLKPANIFVTRTGEVRLLDFGLARLVTAGPLTELGTVMGSPSYIAPEAWRGKSELIGPTADVYSLGVILFRMLSGQLPFAAEGLPDLLLLVTTAERPSLKRLRPDLPPEVDAWVRQALAVDPQRRFRSVRATYNALLSVVGYDASVEAGWLRRLARAIGKRLKPRPARDDAAAWKAAVRRASQDDRGAPSPNPVDELLQASYGESDKRR